MCLGFMSFRAPPAALKHKNYHKSTNMQPIIPYFQGLFKFMTYHISVFDYKLNLFCFSHRHASFFLFYMRHMHSKCAWNMIKQSESLQTRYNTTHIFDNYYVRTHVHVFIFNVKKTRV